MTPETLFKKFELNSQEIKKSCFILKKWDWPFNDYLSFLSEANELILKDNSIELYIFCSHNNVLTNGSGLERDKEGIKHDLIDFNENSDLPYDLFQIKRGGGLTFHHNGQLNIYPLFHLTSKKKNLQTYMMRILKFSAESLNEIFAVDDFHYKGKFLGLWFKDYKLGSIGMGLYRYVTQHGISINFEKNEEMIRSMSSLFPCGINLSNYTSLDSQFDLEKSIKEKFIKLFLDKIIV